MLKKLTVAGREVEVEVQPEEFLADSGMVIMAVRVADAGDAVVEGAVVTPCSECEHDVWISPSSARIHAQGGNPVWCMQCVVAKIETEKPAGPAVQ